MARYGFVGLGIMGAPMAANLLRAGFDVTVWNRNADKCAALVQLGARQGRSVRDVTAACDITFAMLADPAAAEAVCFGPDGVLAGIGDGRGYVDMSTVDDATSRAIATAIAERGGRFLEAPVSGTKKPAIDGTLIVLAAGDRTLYDDVAVAFSAMSKAHYYLGQAGQGARMKLVLNLMMGQMMAGLCEGMALGQQCGLDGETILEIVAAGAMANPMFAIKGPMLLHGEYATSFPLKHMQKDLHLAANLGHELGQPLPCTAAANEAFLRARAEGHADADFSALYETVRQKR